MRFSYTLATTRVAAANHNQSRGSSSSLIGPPKSHHIQNRGSSSSLRETQKIGLKAIRLLLQQGKASMLHAIDEKKKGREAKAREKARSKKAKRAKSATASENMPASTGTRK